MPQTKDIEKLQNMAKFIKRHSQELLYKVNQLTPIVDASVLKYIEQLCDQAEQARQAIHTLSDPIILTESRKVL